MQIVENSEEIRIRHVPVRDWIIGGVLTLITVVFFLWLLFFIFISPRGFSTSIFAAWWDAVPVLMVIAAFLWTLFEIKYLRTPLRTIVVSGQTNSVEIILQRIYGTRRQRFDFTQVDKFKSYKGKLNFSQAYFLALVLANRKTLKLKIPVGTDKLETTRLVKKLNKFVKSKKASNASV